MKMRRPVRGIPVPGSAGWTAPDDPRILAPMPLRVALLAPFAYPSVRGNAVTVTRIAHGLRERGVELTVWDLSVTPEARVAAEVEAYAPALLHAFHAHATGPLAASLARRAGLPLVVTLTGTDANHDLVDAGRAPTVRRVLAGASRVSVFHECIAERVAGVLPGVRGRLVVVPQAVRFDAGEPLDLPARVTLPRDAVLFVFPGGIRPVKRPLLPLGPLGRVAARHPRVRLVYVGPVLDRAEGDALLRALATRPWAVHLGAVPHAQMPSLLARAAVVLNCSISEGGMANSVLEALALGRAVLAADIEGNGTLIEDGLTGLLFRDVDELERAAERLATDAALRARLGEAGRALVEQRYPPARETEGYLDLYRSLVPVSP
jgi:glycosyltransferase involved in cell wall biosynthesis